MPLRDLVLYNFHWKITALLLATLLWFSVKFTIYKGSHQTLRHQPVLVLKAANDPRIFRIQPPEVDVILRATKELGKEDVEVYVNLSTLPLEMSTAVRPILVRGAEDVRVEPVTAYIEQITPPTNALRNP